MKHGILTGIFLLLMAVRGASGADVTVSATVSAEKVSLNDRLQLTVTIAGSDARKADAPKLDSFNGFQLAGTQQASEFQFINGKSSVAIRYIYTLVPRNTGTFTVGGGSVSVGGQTLTIRGVRVEVTAGSSPGQQSSSRGAGGANGGSGNTDIFIRANVDNRQPYVGEQITLTFELYSRINMWGDPKYEAPETSGFWTMELPKVTPTTETVNGRMYNHNAIKTALFPTTAGPLTIGPAILAYTVGGFWGPQETRTLRTNPIPVRVKPLPEAGKPADFSGAVGSFKITASADKNALRAGDVATVTVIVSGDGNLDLVTTLGTPDLSPFKAYDPKVTTQMQNTGFTAGGAKIWEYVLMPRIPGVMTLQPFSLSFFNPKTGKYQTVRTGTLTFRVAPGDPSLAAGGGAADTRSTVAEVAQDINFIKPDKRTLESANARMYRNPAFWLLYILPLGMFIAAVAVKRRYDAIERNSGLKRRLRAWKHAQTRLEHAVRAERAGRPVEFCGFLSEALVRFIGDRLNVDTGSLTAALIEERLTGAGVAPELAENVRKILELCDFVRFSSTGSDPELRMKLLADTRELLTTLRDTI